MGHGDVGEVGEQVEDEAIEDEAPFGAQVQVVERGELLVLAGAADDGGWAAAVVVEAGAD